MSDYGHDLLFGRSSPRAAGVRVLMLIRELDIRIIVEDTGELIPQLTLDPSRDYQPTGRDRYAKRR
jgi:hypothetical protein